MDSNKLPKVSAQLRMRAQEQKERQRRLRNDNLMEPRKRHMKGSSGDSSFFVDCVVRSLAVNKKIPENSGYS